MRDPWRINPRLAWLAGMIDASEDSLTTLDPERICLIAVRHKLLGAVEYLQSFSRVGHLLQVNNRTGERRNPWETERIMVGMGTVQSMDYVRSYAYERQRWRDREWSMDGMYEWSVDGRDALKVLLLVMPDLYVHRPQAQRIINRFKDESPRNAMVLKGLRSDVEKSY